MTPKEKAEQLFLKFRQIPPSSHYTGIDDPEAKQCALIAVDETIEALNLLLKSGLNNDFDVLGIRGFYMEVKQETKRI